MIDRERGRAGRRQHRRPAGAGRLALPLRRGQPGAGVRPRGRAGMRLAVPAGTAVRFEPGIERDVMLVALGGTKTVPGLRLSGGDRRPCDASTAARYAELYGPTVGDRMRLADTDLLIEVTEDRCRGPARRRRGRLRRRQGHPRVDGPGPRHPRRRAPPTW